MKLETIFTIIVIIYIMGTASFISSQNKTINNLENQKGKLLNIIEEQNNEIETKDKFIDEMEKKRKAIRIFKQIHTAKPLDEQYNWLLVNCKNKVC